MKADYLRYIYECLSGDNGLLANFTDDNKKVDLSWLIEKRSNDETRGEGAAAIDFVESEIFNSIH